MVSEGSCDTEDCSNDCRKYSFAITGPNYIVVQFINVVILIFNNIL